MPRHKPEGLFLKNPPFLCRDEGLLRGTTLLGACAPGFHRSVTGTPGGDWPLAHGRAACLARLSAWGALSAIGGMIPCIACKQRHYIPSSGKFQQFEEISSVFCASFVFLFPDLFDGNYFDIM